MDKHIHFHHLLACNYVCNHTT